MYINPASYPCIVKSFLPDLNEIILLAGAMHWECAALVRGWVAFHPNLLLCGPSTISLSFELFLALWQLYLVSGKWLVGMGGYCGLCVVGGLSMKYDDPSANGEESMKIGMNAL